MAISAVLMASALAACSSSSGGSSGSVAGKIHPQADRVGAVDRFAAGSG